MIPKRLVWKLFVAYLIVIVLTLLPTWGYLRYAFKQFYLEQKAADLTARAHLLTERLLPLLLDRNYADIQAFCQSIAGRAQTRITVITPNGQVVGDSDENPGGMDNHADRIEVARALAGRNSHSIRYSDTVNQSMMYVGIPLVHRQEVIAVLRTAVPLTALDQTFKTATERMLGGLVLVLLAAAGFSYSLSRRFSRPIETLQRGSRKLVEGDFSYRLPIPGEAELAGLAHTLNQVAAQMEQRFQTIVRQRNELEAVLESMLEGVIAIDLKENIISVNQAAADMFGVHTRKAWEGRSIQTMVRNTAFYKLVRQGLAGFKPVEGDTVLYQNQARVLHVRVSPLHDFNDRQSGALVVITDVSQVRRLEHIRRDFAANVSHELKTPLTAIKGFVETLMDGAPAAPEEAARFLAIIQKHVLRLEAIIDNLMRLSRIEQAHGGEDIHLKRQPLAPVIADACRQCRAGASSRRIDIQINCSPDIQMPMDRLLLEQALVNLLDNAVKYSHADSIVQARAEAASGHIRIDIQDQGNGIPRHHIPRLFERFYRVDQSRSRSQGGTGLGLAIVKHIVQAHGGGIEVDSVVGQGSCFTLYFPAQLAETEKLS